MFKWMKYISLATLFQDVRSSYEEEQGKGRPLYLSRRFIGAAVSLVGGVLAIKFGVQLDAESLTSLADNIERLTSTLVTIYGIILGIYGYIKRAK